MMDILDYDSISCICSFLSTCDLVALSGTCRKLRLNSNDHIGNNLLIKHATDEMIQLLSNQYTIERITCIDSINLTDEAARWISQCSKLTTINFNNCNLMT